MHYHIVIKADNWDSVLLPLDDNTLALSIQVRVFLQKIEPSERREFGKLSCDGNGNVKDLETGNKYLLDPWSQTEWQKFPNEFKTIVTRYWDNQFDLIPNKPWYKSPKGLTAAKINCGLAVDIVNPAPQNAHAKFMVFNTKKIPKLIRSHTQIGVKPQVGFINKDDTKLEWLNWLPHIYRKEHILTKINGQSHAVDYLHNTLAHEFGHVLGLEHVSGNTNKTTSYGEENIYDADSMMGMGIAMREKFSDPWIKRLDRHLVRQNSDDAKVKFSGKVKTPQLLGFWDNGEVKHVGNDNWIFKRMFGQ
ncbi:hypothetical protein [Dyadobacter sp. 3J3]|uniref:hypothetical protein n=1 Tax=Dyadobacter sp. 3J3 TaxID=2606600 RepID=UPI001359209B|nr:hypothetical protein [Dyadobacter sp. 3J3]